MKKLKTLALCLAAAISAGCADTLKSEYRTPAVNYPAHWTDDAAGKDTAPFNWKAFSDPHLEGWLRQVMAANSDVKIAGLRLSRSRLEAERVSISHAPGLTGSVGAEGRVGAASGAGSSARLSTGYEADLWGKKARQREAAAWESLAGVEDLQNAKLMLLAEASAGYWRIGLINQQTAILEQSIRYAEKTLQLAQARFDAGGASSLDVAEAQQNLLGQENRLTGLKRERLLRLNEQAALLGAPPGTRVPEPRTLSDGPMPQIHPGIPASVLGQRPDIRAREWRVREALAMSDVRRAEYYPAFSLTGSLGSSSTSLITLMHNPVGTAAASLSLPFLEWRQRGVNVKIARNDYEQRVQEFKKALYNAMGTIENELTLRDQLLAQEKRLRKVLALARETERLNEVRYREGAARISFWLDAQEKRRQAELELAENRFSQFRNLAGIYAEFGGPAIAF